MIRTLAIAMLACLLPLASAQKEGEAYRIGDGVSPPSVLKKVEPEYTPEAKAARIEGTVLLSILISEDGKVEEAEAKTRSLKNKDTGEASANDFGLVEKAREAVLQWKFRPGNKNGQPVSVRAMVEINFRLQ